MSKPKAIQASTVKECFAIMPISDPDGYENGHFQRVYEDLIKPACEKASYTPHRADETIASNLIQLDIIQKIVETPMAICDLSSRNPNVLFELGIRQAFNMPVVLIRQESTPEIFDIQGLRYLEYCPHLKYRDVVKKQTELSDTIKATAESANDPNNTNSIVTLLGLRKAASIPDLADNGTSAEMSLLRSEIQEVRSLLRSQSFETSRSKTRFEPIIDKLQEQFEDIMMADYSPETAINPELDRINEIAHELFHSSPPPSIRRKILGLLERVETAKIK